MSMRILGKVALERKLRRMPEAVKAASRTAMEAVAGDIVQLARSLLPAGGQDYAALSASIGWTWGKPPSGSITLGKVLNSMVGAEMTLTIYAGNDEEFYARWVEFGTGPHDAGGWATGKTHPGTAANPFFYPAFRANKRPGARQINGAMRKAVRKIAKEKAAD